LARYIHQLFGVEIVQDSIMEIDRPLPRRDTLHSFVALRSLSKRRATMDPEQIHRKLAPAYSERELTITNSDKIFTAVWLDSHQVLMGTKCNKLLLHNAKTQKIVSIPFNFAFEGLLPREQLQQQKYQQMLGFRRFRRRLHSQDLSMPGTFDRAYMRNDTPSHMQDYSHNAAEPLDAAPPTRPPEYNYCYGIHTIALNDARTIVAVGAGKPNELVLYSYPSFDVIAVLRGHTDRVFSAKCLDNSTLVSSSRDKTVKIWKLGIVSGPQKHDSSQRGFELGVRSDSLTLSATLLQTLDVHTHSVWTIDWSR